ncbi:MAG: hypothetical protein EX271_06465 [Acidimicrobiales bacterium]|nr:hypothetical protein [Hyphomonadaceae bacterium]RZV42182.1 MAG: hypothetical protein EX271_06465 [Acidimicrobiales bacterium]
MWNIVRNQFNIDPIILSAKARFWIGAIVFLAPLILLGAVIGQPWVDPKWFFFDFLTAAEFSDDCCHVYYGFISNLGIFLWIATSAVCLFAALMMWINGKSGKYIKFALFAGLLSGWLGMDDAFLLHEVVFPKLGVPQFAVLAVYVVLALAYVLSSWRVILASEFWILGLSAVAMAISLGVDQVLHSIETNAIVLEDSAKFFGIFAWFVFHVTALALVMQRKNQTDAA